ncbi:MAG: hypothetical protein NVS2B4_09450 [Ramlibacter sp.]
MATPLGSSVLPEPLEDYAVRFDPLLHTPAQRRGFRAYVSGLLLPRERNKTLTALAGAEPVVQAQAAAVQRLQFFLCEAAWDSEAVNAKRLALLAEQSRGSLRTPVGYWCSTTPATGRKAMPQTTWPGSISARWARSITVSWQ